MGTSVIQICGSVNHVSWDCPVYSIIVQDLMLEELGDSFRK